jgi:hypothetical protein
MPEVNVALAATALLHLLHFREKVDDEIAFLPAMTDPADVPHATVLIFVAVGIGTDAVNSPDHSSDDRQWVFTKLLRCSH